MTLSSALRRLADVIDDVQSEDVEVEAVDHCTGDSGLTVDLRLRIDPDTGAGAASSSSVELGPDRPVDGPGSPRETRDATREDGAAGPGDARRRNGQAPVDGTGDDPEGPPEAEPQPVAAGSVDPAAGDGTDSRAADEPAAGAGDEPADEVPCRHGPCDATFGTEHGMKIHYTKVHLSGGDVSEPPAHRDPAALRRVYAECDSFAEMRDALDTDASAQTVRRQMMKHGIHEPGGGTDGTDGTDGAADHGSDAGEAIEAAQGDDGPAGVGSGPGGAAESSSTGGEAAVGPDGGAPDAGEGAATDAAVGDHPDVPPGVEAALPGDLSVADLEAAVAGADTLFQVERELGLDREATRDLLSAFDLLELVHGRVATKADRDERKAEIAQRISRSAPGPQRSSSD